VLPIGPLTLVTPVTLSKEPIAEIMAPGEKNDPANTRAETPLPLPTVNG
jgi:hypothetical protein